MVELITGKCAWCETEVIRPKRLAHGDKMFCCRQHSAFYYGKQRAEKMPHGTQGGYRKGCRCDPCRAANAFKAARYRRNRSIVRDKHPVV